MVYGKDFVFLNEDSGAVSDIYFNKPVPIEEMCIQVAGTAINLTVEGRNGGDEAWIPITCIGNTPNGLSVTHAITAAGLWTLLTLPTQIRVANNGTPGSITAYAQIHTSR